MTAFEQKHKSLEPALFWLAVVLSVAGIIAVIAIALRTLGIF